MTLNLSLPGVAAEPSGYTGTRAAGSVKLGSRHGAARARDPECSTATWELPMRGTLLALAVLVVFCSATWAEDRKPRNALPSAVLEKLTEAETIEVLSLDPEAPSAAGQARFFGLAVLGSAAVTDKAKRAALLKAVAEAAEEASFESIANCFRPRHGLRAKSGGVTIEVGICFECNRLEIAADGKAAGSRAITKSAEKHLDDLLTAAKVPLAKKPTKDK